MGQSSETESVKLFRKAGATLLLFMVCVPSGLRAQVDAFPGAEGFGRVATGGRSGVVYEVTNLNDDSNPGSLRYAINQSGTRTIVFRVSGTIALTNYLKITKGNLTIAGQTAPGDGICLRGYTLSIQANNIVIRYIRSRLGDIDSLVDDACHSDGGADTSTTYHNVIIDHCSFSWAVDENASFYNDVNFTLQWCIISESLTHSFDPKGNHGYGGIWGGIGATFHHNLLADNSSRNPRFCGARYHYSTAAVEIVDFRNNVIFNWGFNSAYGGESGNHNMVNNYFKPGPATSTGKYSYRIVNPSDSLPHFEPLSKWYVDGNYIVGNTSVTADNWNGGVQPQNAIPLDSFKLASPLPFAPVATESAQNAYTSVLASVGCNFPTRDSADLRVVNEAMTGIAPYGATYGGGLKGILDSQRDVGGWPILNSTTPPLDSDHDGMPDDWEIAHGLNPNDATDRNTVDSVGYTMLEDYINSLVPSISTGVAIKPESFPKTLILYNSYPNPFNPVTTISYELPVTNRVSLRIYDINGREVATLVDGVQVAGLHRVEFDGQRLASGIYVARLQESGFSRAVKLVLLK